MGNVHENRAHDLANRCRLFAGQQVDEAMITGHFVEAFEPLVDGVVRVAQSYREHMERELGPSWVVAPNHRAAPAGEARVLRYGVRPFVAPYRLGFAVDSRVRAQLARVHWDLVHAHSPFSAGQLAVEAARLRGVPVVFSLHTRYAEWARAKYRVAPRWASVVGADAWLQPACADRLHAIDLVRATPNGEEYVTRAVKRNVWRYAARSACVIVSTHAERDELLSFAQVAGGKRPIRIEVIRPGIRPFQPVPHGFDVRARHGLPNVPLLLYVGQLADEKGLPFLLTAISERRARSFPFRLLIVGDGPRRAHYESLARRLGIADRCVFVGAISDADELGVYYRAASLLLLPSFVETRASVAMEAASVGLCTLGLRGAPGVSELIQDGDTGFLAQPDVTAYATCLTAVLRDTALRTRVGERARQLVRTCDAAAADVVELYRDVRGEVMSRSAPPASGTYRAKPVQTPDAAASPAFMRLA